jgi:hypothetical protein
MGMLWEIVQSGFMYGQSVDTTGGWVCHMINRGQSRSTNVCHR